MALCSSSCFCSVYGGLPFFPASVGKNYICFRSMTGLGFFDEVLSFTIDNCDCEGRGA